MKEAEKLERELISALDLTNEDKGYNYAEGGIHPRHSERTKRKIGEQSKGRHHTDEFKQWISQKNSGSGNFMYGKHHTEKTRRKISESRKGGTSSNKGKFGSSHPCAKGVIAYDPITGEEVQRFGSIVEAAHYIHKYPSGIQSVLKGEQLTSGGLMWRRADG